MSNSEKRWIAGSKVEDLRLGSQVDQVGSAVQGHVREKLRLVNLTGVCAGSSDANEHLMFDKVGQEIIRTITCHGFGAEIPRPVSPQDTAVDQKKIYVVALGMSDFGQLKTPGRRLGLISAQHK